MMRSTAVHLIINRVTPRNHAPRHHAHACQRRRTSLRRAANTEPVQAQGNNERTPHMRAPLQKQAERTSSCAPVSFKVAANDGKEAACSALALPASSSNALQESCITERMTAKVQIRRVRTRRKRANLQAWLTGAMSDTRREAQPDAARPDAGRAAGTTDEHGTHAETTASQARHATHKVNEPSGTRRDAMNVSD